MQKGVKRGVQKGVRKGTHKKTDIIPYIPLKSGEKQLK